MTKLFRLVCLLSLSVNCFAQEEIPVSLRDFSGGLNDNRAGILLQPNEASALLNVVVDDPWGAVRTRDGIDTCGNTPSGNAPTGAHEYIQVDGDRYLILTDNETVWATLDCINFSTITTGLSSLAVPYFDTFRDKLWMVNKSTWTTHWDGTTTTRSTESPVAQYITHWKERVWMARTTSIPSLVQYSSLVDDSGVTVDPSVSTQVWDSANAFYVGRDDGSPIYGMKVYKDNLFIFKQNGIYKIVYESDFDNALVKTVTDVGCKFQDTIVEVDDFLYFVGNDGIYKFDGNSAIRVSDNINGIFRRLKQPNRLDKQDVWDTAADWGAGTFSGISSTTAPGSIELSGAVANSTFSSTLSDWTQGTNCNLAFDSIGSSITYNHGAGQVCTIYKYNSAMNPYGTYSAGIYLDGIPSASYWNVPNMDFMWLQSTYDPNTSSGYSVRIGTLRSTPGTELFGWRLRRHNAGVITDITPFYSCASTSGGTLSGTLTIAISTSGLITASLPGCTTLSVTDTNHSYVGGYLIYSVLIDGNNSNSAGSVITDITISSGGYVSSGTWTSEQVTYSSLSKWGVLDIDQTLNGKTITYSVRSATASYNLGLVNFSTITPGMAISTIAANNVFQWRAVLASDSANVSPKVNSGIANYQEGDISSDRLNAINYKNNYMIAGATSTDKSYNTAVIVKTKSPLDNFVVWDLPISVFTKWNDYLYGGIANSSSVARLNYGTSDNGVAINSYWTWGDQHFGALAYKKSLNETYTYYVPTQSSANTYLRYSVSGSTITTTKTINMTGSNSFGVKQNLINGGTGNAFSITVGNNSLDQTFKLLGLDLWSKRYNFRE